MNSESTGPVPHDFCQCGVPNALTATVCAGCGTYLNRTAVPVPQSQVSQTAPEPYPQETQPEPVSYSQITQSEERNPLDSLRQSLGAQIASDDAASDKDDFAQGFDFCPQCQVPNALNRAVCAGCGAKLSRDGMLQPPVEAVAPIAPPEGSDGKARYARDLRPPRPTTLKSAPPVADFAANEGSPAAQEAPAYDFCTCGVPNALSSRVCAGCGKDLDRTGLPTSLASPKPQIGRAPGLGLTKRLIEQGAQRLNDTVQPLEIPPQPAAADGAQLPYDFCKCGVPNALTALVCAGCGERLEGRSSGSAVATQANTAIPMDSVIFCSTCGVPNQNDAVFCAGCGQSLNKTSGSTPTFAPVSGVICAACGADNSKGSTLCYTCGGPLQQRSAAASAGVTGLGPLPSYRHPLLVFVLTLISVDLYRTYWNYTITKEVQNCLQEELTPPSMTVYAFLGSCGLYDFYWDWIYAKKIAKIMDIVGLEPVDYSWLFLFLNVTVVGRFAIPALMQVNLNEITQAFAWEIVH